MGGLRTLCIFAFIALALGCDSLDDTFTDCNLGTITGQWRIQLTETSGDCGPVPDETVILNGNVRVPSGECGFSSTGTEDQCRIRGTSECPTTNDLGMQEWTWALTQTAADQVEGNATVQTNDSTLGNCRSTYDVTITQL